MARRSAPRSSRCVANECRTTWGLSDRGRLARRPYVLRIFQKPTRVRERPRPGAGRRQVVSRALLDAAVERQETVKAADRGDRSCDGSRREPGRHLPTDEGFERRAIERLDVSLFPTRVPRERRQISAIAL